MPTYPLLCLSCFRLVQVLLFIMLHERNYSSQNAFCPADQYKTFNITDFDFKSPVDIYADFAS